MQQIDDGEATLPRKKSVHRKRHVPENEEVGKKKRSGSRSVTIQYKVGRKTSNTTCSTTTEKQERKRGTVTGSQNDLSQCDVDPFVGKIVAISCESDTGKKLIESLWE